MYNKIIIAIIFVIFNLHLANAWFEKNDKSFDRYNTPVSEKQMIDALYFPGWDLGMTKSKTAWPRTPYVFEKFHWNYNNWYRLFEYLYFWKDEYNDENFNKLFHDINSKFNIEYRLKNKLFSSYNTEEKLKKDLQKILLEIDVDKYRFKNNYKANKSEKDINNKLEKIYKLIWESYWKTNAWLQIKEDKNKEICGENISQDFTFNTWVLLFSVI